MGDSSDKLKKGAAPAPLTSAQPALPPAAPLVGRKRFFFRERVREALRSGVDPAVLAADVALHDPPTAQLLREEAATEALQHASEALARANAGVAAFNKEHFVLIDGVMFIKARSLVERDELAAQHRELLAQAADAADKFQVALRAWGRIKAEHGS